MIDSSRRWRIAASRMTAPATMISARRGSNRARRSATDCPASFSTARFTLRSVMRRASPCAATIALIVPEDPIVPAPRGRRSGIASRKASSAKLRIAASRSGDTFPEDPKISVSRTAPSPTL